MGSPARALIFSLEGSVPMHGVLRSLSEQQDVVSTKSLYSIFPTMIQTHSDRATLGLETSAIRSSKIF